MARVSTRAPILWKVQLPGIPQAAVRVLFSFKVAHMWWGSVQDLCQE